jgi:hypothetical protein
MTWFLDKEFLESLDLGAYDPARIAASTGVSLDVAAAFVDPRRRYWVRSVPEYGWLAGATGEGKPALLFVGQPRLSADGSQEQLNAVIFDHETCSVTHRAVHVPGEQSWDSVMDAAAQALGFLHVGDCPALAFKHPDLWHYALVPFDWEMHGCIIGKNDDARDMVRDWIERGSYVLHCGNAYYMSADGEVESS